MRQKLVRRIVLAGAALALPAGVAAVVATTVPATAAQRSPATAVKFTGSVACTVKGKVTASPPITFSTQTSKISLTATLSKCSGSTKEKGVTISGGTLTAATSITGSCTSLNNFSNPKGSIKWKATGVGAAKTTVGFSNGGASINSSTGVITLNLPGSGGTSTAAGSFAGSTSKATVVLDQTEDTLAGDCFSGVSTLTFSGTNGKSTLSVG
jgi:hypothetical protein